MIAFLLLWEFIFSRGGDRTFLYSKPSLIFAALLANIRNGVLINDFKTTGLETLLGFLLGNAVGLVMGFSLWYSRALAYISRPYIIAIGAIPIFSLAPMTIMWFGTGLFAKVMMAALSTFTISLTQSFAGAQNVDKNMLNLMETFGASRLTTFSKIIVPSSIIWVVGSLRLNIGFALLGAFIGEFITSQNGLGFRILKASSLYDTSLVFASLICLILLAFVFNWIVSVFERKVSHWKIEDE